MEKSTMPMTTDAFLAAAFEQAVAEKASDIHFERLGDAFVIRFRIDGVLQERWSLPVQEMDTVINSLKVLANLDITEKEVPQDGHFEFYDKASGGKLAVGFGEPSPASSGDPSETESDSTLDVRLSVYPSIKGSVAVARLLNRRHALLSLAELGMDGPTLGKVKKMISRDYGMILVTGPVGSGKTTTLYSFMEALRNNERVIMTIEDPVEFHLEWLRQSELRPQRGFNFERALSSILRQDPDVLMIGEIRDQATANHAISVSLVGRIVGSTIHSNSNTGTIARLIDLQIDRGMIAYAINGIISQRLLRKICPSCTEEYRPEAATLDYFGLSEGSHRFVHGKGCDACHGTGYSGRTGIYEVLLFDPSVRSLIVDKASMEEIERAAIAAGMKTLKQDAVDKVLSGLTTLEEAIKAV